MKNTRVCLLSLVCLHPQSSAGSPLFFQMPADRCDLVEEGCLKQETREVFSNDAVFQMPADVIWWMKGALNKTHQVFLQPCALCHRQTRSLPWSTQQVTFPVYRANMGSDGLQKTGTALMGGVDGGQPMCLLFHLIKLPHRTHTCASEPSITQHKSVNRSSKQNKQLNNQLIFSFPAWLPTQPVAPPPAFTPLKKKHHPKPPSS